MLTIIPHIQQVYDWDCGVACVCMVLNGIGIRINQNTIHQFYPLSSLWSIDLAYLLRHYGVRNAILNDVKRVHSLFARAKDQGVNIINVGLSLDDLKRFLASNRYAVILLVNVNLMTCHLCMAEKRKEACCCSWPQFLSKKSRIDEFAHSSSNTYNRTHNELAGQNTLLDFDVDVDILSGSSVASPIPVIQPSPTSNMSILPSIPKPAASSSSMVNQPSTSVQRRLSFGGMLLNHSSPPPINMNTSMPNLTTPSISSSYQSTSSIPHQSTLPPIPSTPSSPLIPKYPPQPSTWFAKPSVQEFVGHYVVVIGYDWKSDCFFYRDPGSESGVCAIKADLIMKAWRSKGTDQDAIVVKIL